MIKSLKISKKLENYIAEHSYELNPVQKEIINVLCHGTGGVLSSAASVILSKDK